MKPNKEHPEKHHKQKRWIGCDVEEEYLGEDRKQGKIDRKMATSKDRSKYKKTDQDKLQKQDKIQKALESAQGHLLKGRVLSINPQGIMVDFENQTIVCMLRGVLKKEKSLYKNLVTVGDFVLFEKNADGSGSIVQVTPRHSVLSRADNLSRRKEQLIASNIDQVIITTSVVNPPLKPALVDRYVIATQKGNMQPVIVVNKIDLLTSSAQTDELEREKELYEQFLKAYDFANIPVIAASIVTGEGIDALRAAMKDKASVFSGQSGVGKSSLINAATGLDLRVGEVVERTKKGSHTTTTANLLRLEYGGWCIDTPGIKSFGIWDLKQDEIEPYFVEIHAHGRKCKFPDCTHIHETDCAVQEAVENGEIPLLRYQSYLFLMHSLGQEHIRR